MEFSVKSGSPEKQRSACVVVGVFEPRRLSPVAEQLDKISDGYLSSLLRRGDLEGKPGQMLLLHQVPGVLSERVLLVGCGKEWELDERQYKQIINKTITTLNETGSMEAVVASHPLVAECAVIGVHDDLKGQVPRAFVLCGW